MNKKLLKLFVMLGGALIASNLFELSELSFTRKKRRNMDSQSIRGKQRDPLVVNVIIVKDQQEAEQEPEPNPEPNAS